MGAGHDEKDSGFLRFSTDDFPLKDRLAQWREICGRAVMKVDMDPPDGQTFRCEAELRQLQSLGIASITTTANRLTRSRGMLADNNHDFILVIPGKGDACIGQRDREAMLAPGNAWLVPADEPSTTVVRTLSHFISLAIPASALRPLITRIDAALLPVAPGNADIVHVLYGYVETLCQGALLADAALRQTISAHIYDLVAIAVGATRDAVEQANGRGVKAARLVAIKNDINANLHRHELSIGMIALKQGVTPRYVRKLFEQDDISFAEYVLALRLARAHRMLIEDRLVRRPISTIAFDCGFADLSYFNRTFRRRFGMTPSDVRAQARNDSQ